MKWEQIYSEGQCYTTWWQDGNIKEDLSKRMEVLGETLWHLEFWLSEIYEIENLSTERYHSRARIRKYLSVQGIVIQYGIICLMTTNSWDSALKSNKKVLRMFHWEILWICTDTIKLQNLTQTNAVFQFTHTGTITSHKETQTAHTLKFYYFFYQHQSWLFSFNDRRWQQVHHRGLLFMLSLATH